MDARTRVLVSGALAAAVAGLLAQGVGIAQTCSVTCTADVPASVQVADAMAFKGSYAASSGCPAGDAEYEWTAVHPTYEYVYCSGKAPAGNLPDCKNTPYSPDTVSWKLVVTKYSYPPCIRTGVLNVSGLYLGAVKLNADTTTKNAENDYTLSGHVRANNVLDFSGPVRFQGSPWGNTGDFFTDSDLSVATTPTATKITSGAGQVFALDGNFAIPRFTPQVADPLAPLALKLNGVPLYLMGTSIGIDKQAVVLSPTVFVGKPGSLHLASLQLDIGLAPGLPLQIESGSLVNGEGAPGIEVESVRDLTYDAVTDKLAGTLDLSFPFLNVTRSGSVVSVPTALEVENGCINTVEVAPSDASGLFVRLKTDSRPFLLLSGLSVTNICEPNAYAPIFFGDMYFHDVPVADGETIKGSAWLYEPPRWMSLLRGNPSFLGLPVSSPGASWVGLGSYDAMLLKGTYGIGGRADGDVLRGKLGTGFLSWSTVSPIWTSVGHLQGDLTLDAACACPDDGGDACQAARIGLLALYGSGSVLPDKSFSVDAAGARSNLSFLARFSGKDVFRDLSSLGVTLTRVQAGPTTAPSTRCWLGSNLTARPTTSPSSLGAGTAAAFVERSVTLTSAAELAVFGVRGTTGTLPSVYLVTPSGQVVRPETTGQTTGTTYAADSTEMIAEFVVRSARPGTWTIGEDNLAETAVSFTVLAPTPPPVTAFTNVQPSGTTVGISVSVTPASADTRVSLYYSLAHDGVPQGTIASGLAATTGSVAATWDTSALPSGTYFLLAITDDGKNPPVTAFAPAPLTRDVGGLEPPTGVRGVRLADTVTLSWTRSVSATVTGYTVLYTSDPTEPGYPESAAVPLPTGATLTGLLLKKGYRFCVAAYDSDGNQSPCSAPVEVGPGHRMPRVGLPQVGCLTLGPQGEPTFTDVTSWACPIRAVVTAGLMPGCGEDRFCPDRPVTRGEAAAILENAMHKGARVRLAPASGLFTDVPASAPNACYIEQLFIDHVTNGCSASPLRFCPDDPVTRETLAVLLVRAKHGASYVPAACTGMFGDVVCSRPAAPFVEQIARECISNGCSASPPLYCPDSAVTRAQLALFLWRAFLLPQACGVPTC
jgi:hypothetical protein